MMSTDTALAAHLTGHPLVARIRTLLGADSVCAVGGVVRDALLARAPGDDIDLVVEGDALALAERLAERLRAPLTLFPRFGTAEIALDDGRIDIAGARREHYPRAGELPEVEPGTLMEDLARRDFTVNAMAFGLSGPHAGRLLDPHDGRRDLALGLLRTLRPGSLREDPSRLVRAARYVARLDLRFAAEVEGEAREVASALAIDNARVGEELPRLLREATAARALATLAALGVPWIEPDPTSRVAAVDRAIERLPIASVEFWALRAGAAIVPAALAVAAMPGWARVQGREVRDGESLAAALARDPRPSAVDRLLRSARPAAVIGAWACGCAEEAVARWWNVDRERTLAICGHDLRRAGVAAGPAIGRGLRAAREAMIDGRADDREQQLTVALRGAGQDEEGVR